MTNIEKRHIIDINNLSGEDYFTSILREAYDCGLLYDYDIEKLQLECIRFLAYKSERYNSGDSSSIRIETAESIMKSNLYTIGLYLKSLPDADYAVSELKSAGIDEMYQKGRELIKARLRAAKDLYRLAQKNRLDTQNYTYNSTLSDNGIGSFFKLYDSDYEAHETMASIDYQLCNPVIDLAGVEYIQKYLVNLYLENEFCSCFASEDIHHLLSGYDVGYRDLLINIFEQVLTGALGCVLANRSAVNLRVSKEDISCLQNKLSQLDDRQIGLVITRAAEKVEEELNISNPSLRSYMTKGLPKITTNIICAVRTDTLDRTFAAAVNPDLKPRVEFRYGKKMEDDDYRELIYELLACRYSADKLALIKERIKSFGDFEGLLFDAQLTKEEVISAFRILGDVELAALIKRHPFKSGIQAVDLSEDEQNLRLYLQSYIDRLAPERQKRILEIMSNLIDD